MLSDVWKDDDVPLPSGSVTSRTVHHGYSLDNNPLLSKASSLDFVPNFPHKRNFIKCKLCSFQTQCQDLLALHCQRVHNRTQTDVSKRYRCHICEKTFRVKTHYIGHLNKHSGLKPYACVKCGKGFIHKCSLVRHENAHHLEQLDHGTIKSHSGAESSGCEHA